MYQNPKQKHQHNGNSIIQGQFIYKGVGQEHCKRYCSKPRLVAPQLVTILQLQGLEQKAATRAQKGRAVCRVSMKGPSVEGLGQVEVTSQEGSRNRCLCLLLPPARLLPELPLGKPTGSQRVRETLCLESLLVSPQRRGRVGSGCCPARMYIAQSFIKAKVGTRGGHHE